MMQTTRRQTHADAYNGHMTVSTQFALNCCNDPDTDRSERRTARYALLHCIALHLHQQARAAEAIGDDVTAIAALDDALQLIDAAIAEIGAVYAGTAENEDPVEDGWHGFGRA